MDDLQPGQVKMRSPELAHALVVVNERDQAGFEAKGYEYVEGHREAEIAPEPTEPAAPETPAVDAEAFIQPDTKPANSRATKKKASFPD